MTNDNALKESFLISSEKSACLLIDAQEQLVTAMCNGTAAVDRIVFLCKCAEISGVPMIVTEQYPKGLGSTVTAIAPYLENAIGPISKIEFSVCASEGAQKAIDEIAGRNQFILMGFESHVCVLQTALELVRAGKEVFVVSDAVSSRHTDDKEYAFARLRQMGVVIVSAEMVVFEWLGKAGSPEFKAISPLLR